MNQKDVKIIDTLRATDNPPDRVAVMRKAIPILLRLVYNVKIDHSHKKGLLCNKIIKLK